MEAGESPETSGSRGRVVIVPRRPVDTLLSCVSETDEGDLSATTEEQVREEEGL